MFNRHLLLILVTAVGGLMILTAALIGSPRTPKKGRALAMAGLWIFAIGAASLFWAHLRDSAQVLAK